MNAIGYGLPGSKLRLDLVYNPVGSSLPPSQEVLEAEYKEELGRSYGIEFHRLLTIVNMPVKRFADLLARTGMYKSYMELLLGNFNPATVPTLMCRSLMSVGWDGRLYDCDFNQMLDIGLGDGAAHGALTVRDIGSLDCIAGSRVTTGTHCFGCTAGAGSSCTGALR